MKNDSTTLRPVIGMDLGDKKTELCFLGEHRRVAKRMSVATTQLAMKACFERMPSTLIVLETGTHSRWVSALLERARHEVLVVDPRRFALIARSIKKNDRNDAELLARFGQAAPELLGRVSHRSDECQADLTLVKSRDVLVKERTRLICRVRGLVKACGFRLPSSSSESFYLKVPPHIPELVRPAIQPLLDVLANIAKGIKSLDQEIEGLCKKYPATATLRQVKGVGPVTAVTFILTLEDPRRFRSSRSAASYLGLTPKQRESGEEKPQLHITKAGDSHLRALLVNCAHYILGTLNKVDSDLQRWGLRYCDNGGKNAKKRAAVAVARKLAVLLHSLWLTGEVYDPLRQSNSKLAQSA